MFGILPYRTTPAAPASVPQKRLKGESPMTLLEEVP
jgi:hypothetical protein